jgi:hypothetical protein
MVEDGLSHDGPGGIAGANEEKAVGHTALNISHYMHKDGIIFVGAWHAMHVLLQQYDLRRGFPFAARRPHKVKP